MIKNYLLIAWRMMVRNQVYTIINVLGLTLGLSACIIVYLVVTHELSFDQFHADKERIFRLKNVDVNNNFACDCVPGPVYPTLRDQYAGAEALTGFHGFDAKVTIDDNGKERQFDRTTANVVLASADYFKIFQYQWLAGSAARMTKPSQVVLTEDRAKAYFGSAAMQDIIGKNITYNDSLIVAVAGIVKDWKENSDFKATEFISFSTIEATYLKNVMNIDNWGFMMGTSQSFIKLNPGDNPDEIAAQLGQIVSKASGRGYQIQLESLPEIHLNYGGQGRSDMRPVLYTLSGLAAFILIIAAINFINLSTAQSIGRAREIGIRKVMGSMRRQIVVQFLSETIVLAFLSLCLSLALIRPLLLLFSNFVPTGVTFDPLSGNNWLFLGGLLILISLLAGSYPALVMSSFRPAIALSGRKVSRLRNSFSLRKSLIVFQFSVSLFFIIATLVISAQMNFINKEDKGFSTSSVLTFNTNWRSKVSKVEALAERLRGISQLEDVAVQGSTPMGFNVSGLSYEYSGKKERVAGEVSVKAGDEHYIPLYKIRLLAGRNIQHSDTLREVVINESLMKAMGFKEPQEAIGERIRIGPKGIPICGVVQDFHQTSFRDPIKPCVIGVIKNDLHSIAIRMPAGDVAAMTDLILKVQSEFKQVYPDESFNYHYIDDEINQMHGEEQKTANLATIAMIITIFISCMGVFGLAMFTSAMRTREIGIRKVFGATSISIVNMLNREFVLLIVISIVVATPVAWYYMNSWLLGFTYRIGLSWWFFANAAGIALITGLITVGLQSWKAATGDPATALKTE